MTRFGNSRFGSFQFRYWHTGDSSSPRALRGTYCSLNAKTTLSLGTFRSVQMRFAWATMHDLCARRSSQFASELRRDKLQSRVTCRLRFVPTSYLSTTGHLVTFSGRFSSLHFIRRHVKLSAFFRHARCTSTSLPPSSRTY